MGLIPARIRLTCAVLAAAPSVALAADATLTWDANPATAGVQGGAGTWADAGTANWFNGTNNVAWTNANVDSALFNAAPAGLVNVSGTVAARFVTFDVPGYALSGGVIRIGRSGSDQGGVVANADATIASAIQLTSGGDGWYKAGAGTLTLGGNNTSSQVTFTIKEGTVAISSKGNISPNTRVTNFARLLYTGSGSDLLVNVTPGTNASDAGILDVAGASAFVNLNGLLLGQGMLVKQGLGTFSPRYTNGLFTGLVRVDAGTLQLDSGSLLNARPVNLNGGTLALRSETPTDFQSPVTARGTGNVIRLDRTSTAGASNGAHLLPSFQNIGTTDLTSPVALGLSVASFSNTGTINLNNTLLTVTGAPFVTPAGAPPGKYQFGHNASAAADAARGFWIANASGGNVVNSTFAGQTEDADLLVGLKATGVAVSGLTLNGSWLGGGGSATSTLAITNSAQVTLGPLMHVHTLAADRTAVRPFAVEGAGSARSTLLLDPAFVADHTGGGATDDGFAQIRLTNVTLVSQNSASLPAVTKLASAGGPTHRAGLILFDNPDRSFDSGAQWVVRASDQTYGGAVQVANDGQIKLEKNLTVTGAPERYADNQFQIASSRALTLAGPGTLTFAGVLGMAPSSRLNGNDATVVFNADPGSGWYTGHYIRQPDGSLPGSPPTPVNSLALYVGDGTKGGVVFNAPVTRLAELHVSGTAVASVSASAFEPKVLRVAGALTVAHAANHYLDLKNNALVTSGVAAGALAMVRGMIQGGDVRSTLADAAHGLGYARASDVATPTPIPESYQWLGQTVAATDVLVRFTLAGDANLDGAVDFQDLVRLAQNYNTPTPAGDSSGWARSDFTGDGMTDFNDLVKLAQNYNASLPSAPLPGASASFKADVARAFAAAAPEPSAGVLAAVAVIIGSRRRRCRRGSRADFP